MATSSSNQARSAQHIYNARADEYDKSWHPSFAQHIVDSLKLQPGERLLDLACGTGLVTLPAAKAVRSTGTVVGVDITDGMLAELQKKIRSDPQAYKHLTTHNHDITELYDITSLDKGSFDAVSMTSALPLLREPGLALHSCKEYLKPGGRIITDTTDIHNMPHVIAMERVYNRLDIEFSSNRSWSRDGASLRQVLQQAGYEIEKVWQRETTGAETAYHSIGDAETRFNNMICTPSCRALVDHGLVEEARILYKEEWAALAVYGGRIKGTFFVWVGLAKKPASKEPITARGSCACGKLSWSTTATSANSSANCYCSTCRKISGSPYITFLDVPLCRFTYSPPLGWPYLKLFEASPYAQRGFCGECGSTLSMWYRADPDNIHLAVGSLDENRSVEGWYKGPESHIYLKDVPSWHEVAEGDGLRRNETMVDADKMFGGQGN